MLAAEAVRLVAMEILLPTAAQTAGGPYPTRAGARVFDSRAPSLSDIDEEAEYTPVLSLYTPESGVALRGPMTDAGDAETDAVLDVVSELCIVARDGDGPAFADAMADGDPSARLVLAALASRVRYLLEFSQVGLAWRRLVRRVIRVENRTFAVPEYGLRWQRMTTRFHLSIRDDDFDVAAGGLPEPIRSVCDALPDGSYAKAQLQALGEHFAAEPPTALAGMDFTARIPGGTEINGVVGTPKP
ncbi:hypothetical protein NBH20_01440 [Rhizobium sp. S153]|uniref:Uncharacterized protein n=1 Tax=Ciceribacter sichuanensis TaxID=2949647 RepID=A0ABT0V5C8_9HYPH|nr:hypothetical protein [Ciceribacter sp. S153]MCM2399805.1 hypothetical protein [Ciceribacter sp. S153]